MKFKKFYKKIFSPQRLCLIWTTENKETFARPFSARTD